MFHYVQERSTNCFEILLIDGVPFYVFVVLNFNDLLQCILLHELSKIIIYIIREDFIDFLGNYLLLILSFATSSENNFK